MTGYGKSGRGEVGAVIANSSFETICEADREMR